MFSLDVEQDIFNTFVISIIVSCVVVLRGLILLKMFELVDSLLLGLQNSSFPGVGLMFNGLTESFLNCLDFFLLTHSFATHYGIVTLDGLEILLTPSHLLLELHIPDLQFGELFLQGRLVPSYNLYFLNQLLSKLFTLFQLVYGLEELGLTNGPFLNQTVYSDVGLVESA